ncbi:MAG: tRNA pseudouridine(55) synthase TruB [Acidobacteriota bacterium]
MSSLMGILLVDKPRRPTSHDVVQVVRRLTGLKRVGHTGTLDPFATGLLPLCLGRATRLARFISGTVKTYRAVVRFGVATDTYDVTGRPLGPPVRANVGLEELGAALDSFLGEQQQVPPPFAAKRVGGRRTYDLARAGIPVEPRPVTVTVRRICLLAAEADRATLEVEVESGTYIRSLAHDLGMRLGCGAHLEQLRRTGVGRFRVERALTIEKVRELAQENRLRDVVVGPREALADFPQLRLDVKAADRLCHGRSVSRDDLLGDVPELRAGELCCFLGPDGEFLAVGVAEEGLARFRPQVVLAAPAQGYSQQSQQSQQSTALQHNTGVL